MIHTIFSWIDCFLPQIVNVTHSEIWFVPYMINFPDMITYRKHSENWMSALKELNIKIGKYTSLGEKL